MQNIIKKWQSELMAVSNPEKIKIFSSFFKTGKGEYGEGDKFIGLSVPINRKVSTRYCDVSFSVIQSMLHDDVHEFRLAALLALVHRYKKSVSSDERKAIVDFYLSNADWCNNWDLVDLSAPYILGQYLLESPCFGLLDYLSISDNLWRQRIAIVSTLMLIRHGRYEDVIRLSKRYILHTHPLIHKATGWMLREVGKRNLPTLLGFLDEFAVAMPRTMLRYAIERLDAPTRQYYMKLKAI